MQKTAKSIPTADQIKAVYQHFGSAACKLLEMNGGVSSEVFILEVDSSNGELVGMTGLDQDTIRAFLSSPEGKAALSSLVADILDYSSAVHADIQKQTGFTPNVVVSINEMWCAAAPVDKNGVVQLTQRASESPNRQEGIMVMIYSERSPASGLSIITRDEDGKATAVLGDLQMEQNSQVSGLLVPDVYSALSALQKTDGQMH